MGGWVWGLLALDSIILWGLRCGVPPYRPSIHMSCRLYLIYRTIYYSTREYIFSLSPNLYPSHCYDEKNFLIVFTLCDSSENAQNNFNGIGATQISLVSYPHLHLYVERKETDEI
jgi:hypothetical protein